MVLGKLIIPPLGGTPWDISTAAYSGVSLDVTRGGTCIFYCHWWKPDGTILYTLNNYSNKIEQWTVSTAWDLTTASYANKYLSSTLKDTYGRISFSLDPNGTILYMMGDNSNTIYQFSLSTAWDISTGTYANKSSLIGTVNYPSHCLGGNGTSLLVGYATTSTIKRSTLSTAWDISTAGTYSNYNSLTQGTSYYGIHFNSNGTKLYLLAGSNDTMFQYTLSTAYNIKTATYDNKSFSVNSQDSEPYTITWKPDGTRFYVTGNNTKKLYEYRI